MEYSLLIELLRQKQNLTELEKDILDTCDEIQKVPFDRNSAQMQVIQNNMKYPTIWSEISALPTTVVRPFSQATDFDIRCNLEKHMCALIVERMGQTDS